MIPSGSGLKTRDSFHSCPDLSSLQITQSDGLEEGINTEPATPTYQGSPHGTPKRPSARKRGVIGLVRAFQRFAAVKMAQPSIKIDTNVQTTKRGLPEDNDAGMDAILGSSDQENPGLDVDDTPDVPQFLCPSVSDIHDKFLDLEWMHRTRVSEGTLSNDPSHRWALQADPQVKARIRYFNVQAWANCRIHLRVPEGECDFINASPIILKDSVTQEERRYIATQGPKLGHLSHFWNMVFHESKEVGVIVMLTQTFEAGREKCAQYFPLDTEQASMILSEESDVFTNDEKHGKVDKVTLLESTFDTKSRSEIRRLELTIGAESKTVWHFLFAGWADYAKPEGNNRDALLELIKLSASKCSADNPRVVHCSAGVGRTGTFIALDHLLRELESGQLLTATDLNSDPVFDTINQMREQRMLMVYNEVQMQFIYDVLREQTLRKLGKMPNQADTKSPQNDERSAKIAKLSDQADSLPESKPELEAVPDRVPTPMRSWSGTPQVSDNDE